MGPFFNPKLSLLRYKVDRITLLVLALTQCIILGISHFSFGFQLISFPVLVFLLLMANIINHNAMHVPLFHSARLNLMLVMWISFLQGHSAARIFVSHQYNHHRHYRSERDWMHSSLAGEGWGFLRMLRYVWRCLWLPNFENRTPALKHIPAKLTAQIHFDRIVMLLALVFWSFYVGLGWAILLLAAQMTAVSCLMILNLLQHDRCDLSSEAGASRDFYGKVLNFFFFNAGYHTAHHHNINIHWSELPSYHKKLSINPVYQEESLWPFLWKNYLSPEEKSHESHESHEEVRI